MPPPFPLEIWQLTIKALYDAGSYSTLSALACANRDLTNESQRWIFHSMEVTCDNVEFVSIILRGSVHLRTTVKDLVIRLPQKRYPKHKWVSEDLQRQFASFLGYVPSLRSFNLTAYCGVDWCTFYTSPKVGMIQALHAVLQLSALETTSLAFSIETMNSVEYLTDILNHCPSLQHLKLHNPASYVLFPFISDSKKLKNLKTLTILGGHIPALDKQYLTSGIEHPNLHIRLESLRLEDINRADSELDRLAFLAKGLPFPLNYLKTLSITLCNPEDARVICYKLLLACAATLEELTISLFCDPTVPLASVPPRVSFPRLRIITTQAHVNFHQSHTHSLESLPSLWGAASELPNLTHVRVNGTCGTFRDESDKETWDLSSGKTDWNATVDAISKWPLAIPSLLEVEVVVEAYTDNDVRKLDNVAELLQTLCDDAVIGVEVNVRRDEMSGIAKFKASLM